MRYLKRNANWRGTLAIKGEIVFVVVVTPVGHSAVKIEYVNWKCVCTEPCHFFRNRSQLRVNCRYLDDQTRQLQVMYNEGKRRPLTLKRYYSRFLKKWHDSVNKGITRGRVTLPSKLIESSTPYEQ